MIVNDLETLLERETIPGFQVKFVHSDNVTVAYWSIKAGSVLPEHAHPHEQITNMLQGEFELVIEGHPRILKTNMVAIIPANEKHSGKALTDCKIIDVFYSVREDYRDTD